MANTFDDLGAPKQVPFKRIFIDPNNPRIAEDREGRYEDASDIFDSALQQRLTERTYEVYGASDLEESIVAQGWIPVDPLIVWEHIDKKGHYVVVEGNTRTAVLRKIRNTRLSRENAKLERLKKLRRPPKREVAEQQEQLDRVKRVIADTDALRVFPVRAKSIADLEQVLPKLLGVRHISHARQWGPYATNRYVLSLYERTFYERYTEKEPLRLEQDLVKSVAELVSLGETKTRRNIQSASAFDHFKRQYELDLPSGESFTDGDHYYFENILQNRYPQEQFGFTKDRLELPPESEKALFSWGFSKPRPRNEDKNDNVFYKAENVRRWNEMARYDAANGTSFGAQLDVLDPENANETMRIMEANFLQHQARQTPMDNLSTLLTALKELRAETLLSQAEFLIPTLKVIGEVVDRYVTMMEADADG